MRAFLFSLMIIVTVASFAVEGVALPKKVLHFNFDGNNAKDLSGNGNDGKINGGKWVEGKFKAALEFNGKDDHVVIPDSKDLDLAQELILSAWVKFQELKAGAWEKLVRKEGAYVVEITGQNKLQMSVWAGGNWQNDQAVGGPNLEGGMALLW